MSFDLVAGNPTDTGDIRYAGLGRGGSKTELTIVPDLTELKRDRNRSNKARGSLQRNHCNLPGKPNSVCTLTAAVRIVANP